jgi:hypothetical protein
MHPYCELVFNPHSDLVYVPQSFRIVCSVGGRVRLAEPFVTTQKIALAPSQEREPCRALSDARRQVDGHVKIMRFLPTAYCVGCVRLNQFPELSLNTASIP